MADPLRLPISSPSLFLSFRGCGRRLPRHFQPPSSPRPYKAAAHMPVVELDYYSLVAIGPIVSAGPYCPVLLKHSKEYTYRTAGPTVLVLVPVPVRSRSHSNRRPTGRRCGLWALGSGYWHRPRCQFGIACPQSLTPGPCRSQGTIDHTFTPTRVNASRVSQAPRRARLLVSPTTTLLYPALHHCRSTTAVGMLALSVRHSLMPQLRRCFQVPETSFLSERLTLNLLQPSPLHKSILQCLRLLL